MVYIHQSMQNKDTKNNEDICKSRYKRIDDPMIDEIEINYSKTKLGNLFKTV